MRSSRTIGILSILLLAPVTAELLQAYLGDVGGPLGLLGFVLFLAPLYGGATLLIREVCVRTGQGWVGRLLLGAAFGVAMATLVDRSLFIRDRADIEGWNGLVTAAPAGGVGWYAAVTWVAGHVLLSVAAPMIVGETLARDPGPWLNRWGVGVTGAAAITVAVLVHRDPQGTLVASGVDYAVAAGVAVALVGLALSPLGRPVPPAGATIASRWSGTALGAFLLLLAVDLTPAGWPGLGVVAVVAVLAASLAWRRARASGWAPADLAALAVGLMLERLLIGVLNPVTEGTSVAEKYAQSGAYLLLLIALALALRQRSAQAHESPGRGKSLRGSRSR